MHDIHCSKKNRIIHHCINSNDSCVFCRSLVP